MSKLRFSKRDTKDFSLKEWMDGTDDPMVTGDIGMKPQRIQKDDFQTVMKHMRDYEEVERHLYDSDKNTGVRIFNKLYKISSIIFTMLLIGVLLYVVSYLPPVGNASNPDNNVVAQRYIENGLEETGAVNIVSGMILTYRAFDTFGETNVLFIATCCVMIMLMLEEKALKEQEETEQNHKFEPQNDQILIFAARVLCPVILVFGIYIILNGHISPGGGFSGGAILGAGMCLYANAMGFSRIGKWFNENVYKIAKISALCMYGLIGSYFYITGANGIENHIPLGIPGHILSSGIILSINIAVGIEVACTMYAFYALFRRGGL